MRATLALASVVAVFGLVATGSAREVNILPPVLKWEFGGGFAPEALPKHEDAPITLRGKGEISSTDGSRLPALREIEIEFDRYGHLDTAGLPVCTWAKLRKTTVTAARRACGDAIVGEGEGTVVLAYPENSPIPVVSPITIFNGPEKADRPTVLVHGRIEIPTPVTYVVPVAIERVGKGIYGYRAVAKVPRFGDGYGYPISASLKVGRRWTSGGRQHSYVSARCQTGKLQLRSELKFLDGTTLVGSLLRRCTVATAQR